MEVGDFPRNGIMLGLRAEETEEEEGEDTAGTEH